MIFSLRDSLEVTLLRGPFPRGLILFFQPLEPLEPSEPPEPPGPPEPPEQPEQFEPLEPSEPFELPLFFSPPFSKISKGSPIFMHYI